MAEKREVSSECDGIYMPVSVAIWMTLWVGLTVGFIAGMFTVYQLMK